MKKVHLNQVGLILFALTIPTVALAAGTAIENSIDWVVDLLTSGIARSLAIIALAVLGYMAWGGRLEARQAGMFIVGIVFIFGGVTIIDSIIAAAS